MPAQSRGGPLLRTVVALTSPLGESALRRSFPHILSRRAIARENAHYATMRPLPGNEILFPTPVPGNRSGGFGYLNFPVKGHLSGRLIQSSHCSREGSLRHLFIFLRRISAQTNRCLSLFSRRVVQGNIHYAPEGPSLREIDVPPYSRDGSCRNVAFVAGDRCPCK